MSMADLAQAEQVSDWYKRGTIRACPRFPVIGTDVAGDYATG